MTLTADYDPENEPETPRQAETRHLAEAERLLNMLDPQKRTPVFSEYTIALASRANAHATLALYYRDLPEVRFDSTPEKKD